MELVESEGAAVMCGGTGEQKDREVDVARNKIVRATARLTIDLIERPDMSDVEKEKVRASRKALDDLLRMTTTAKNVAMRNNWRLDSQWVDAYLAEHGELPVRKPSFSGKLYSYPVIRAALPKLGSNIAASIQKFVDDRWISERYDILIRQIKSCPHYRVGQPAPIPFQSVVLERKELERPGMKKPELVYELRFSPYAGRDSEKLELPIVPRDAFQREQMAKIWQASEIQKRISRVAAQRRNKDVESESISLEEAQLLASLDQLGWKMGQVTIERDAKRLSRFYVRIAYSRMIPNRPQGISAAVNRGMRCFIAAVTASGEEWKYDAEDIEEHLKRTQARRRAFQYASKASQRWGHGRTRTIRPIEHLAGKSERWRDTKNQTIARRLAKWLAERNVSTVYIEDFEGIRNADLDTLSTSDESKKKFVWERIQEWPYHALGTRLVSCLEELGIKTFVVPPCYISQRCPKCGAISNEHIDRRFWMLRCTSTACGFKRHLDVGAAMNVLARGEGANVDTPDDVTKIRNAKVTKKAAIKIARQQKAEREQKS